MATSDAISKYILACKKNNVKKANPKMVKFFQEEEPIAEDIEELDLSNNYIGNRGILALMDVVEKLPNLRSLNLSNQALYNTDLSEDSVKGNTTLDRVVEVLKTHESATALDISSNPVSNYVGRKLLGLAQINKKMCKIEVHDTRIDFDLRKRIATQCERNTVALWENQEAEAQGEEEEGEGGFGAFGEGGGFDPQKNKAPNLSSLGGGTKRKTIHAEGLDPEKAKQYVAPVIEKSEDQVNMIVDLLSKNVLFGFLSKRDLRTVALAMDSVNFNNGDEILTQHGVGDALYVLQSGNCDILKEGQKVFLKTPGTAVGELELMYDSPCAATVKVSTDICETWKLDRDTYRYCVMGSAIRRREEFAKHLESIPFLEELSHYEKMQVADALSTDEWDQGDYIIKYNTEGEWMYIILEGTVEVIGRKNGEKSYVCDFSTGDYIGELEFLNNHETVADVVAKTSVRTAKLNRRHFEMCLGPVLEVLKRNMKHPKYEYYQDALKKNEESKRLEKPPQDDDEVEY